MRSGLFERQGLHIVLLVLLLIPVWYAYIWVHYVCTEKPDMHHIR